MVRIDPTAIADLRGRAPQIRVISQRSAFAADDEHATVGEERGGVACARRETGIGQLLEGLRRGNEPLRRGQRTSLRVDAADDEHRAVRQERPVWYARGVCGADCSGVTLPVAGSSIAAIDRVCSPPISKRVPSGSGAH